ncbi:helix-turn-helix transcriptional regulator [Ideonella sp. BN130291]|uniref:helix-turn-helix transcriptional regulator n=1 Tax=Ideonella sp. BN130291 TaxID=3112940 RepID=UPI002E26D8F4|nr:AraC family transcriptional regulator [Ideonella sp. BN130291]
MAAHPAPDTPAASLAGRLNAGQNFGAMTHRVASADLVVNTAQHAPGMVVPRHEHENPYLCIVLAGGFEMQAARARDCPAGSVIAHPAGHAHANRFGPLEGRCLNLHLGDAWVRDPALQAWLADFRHVALPADAPVVRRLAHEMHASDTAASLAVASAAIELLALAMRADQPAPEPRWIAEAINRIEADLAHAPTLGELAGALQLHPSHLARCFRQARGETLGDYVRRRRVEEAERALAGELTLAEIAAAAGFADQAHFTRVFTRQVGVSPGARRRAMQAGF